MNQCMFAWTFMQLIRDNIKAIYILSHDEGYGHVYEDLIKFYSHHRGHLPWLKGEHKDGQGNFSESFDLDRAINDAVRIAWDLFNNPNAASWLQAEIANLKADNPYTLFGEMYNLLSVKKLKENLELSNLPGEFTLQKAYPYTFYVDTTMEGYENQLKGIEFDTSEVKTITTFRDVVETFRKSRNKLKRDITKLLKSEIAWFTRAQIEAFNYKKIDGMVDHCMNSLIGIELGDVCVNKQNREFVKKNKEEIIRAFTREINKL